MISSTSRARPETFSRAKGPFGFLGFEFGEVEQVGHQPDEPGHVFVHYFQVLAVVRPFDGPVEVVHSAADDSQGRTEFVRHVSQEVGLELVQGLEFAVGPGQFGRGFFHLIFQ